MKKPLFDLISPALRDERGALRHKLNEQLTPLRQQLHAFSAMAGHPSPVIGMLDAVVDRVASTALGTDIVEVHVLKDPHGREPSDHAVSIMRALDACFRSIGLDADVSWGYDSRDRPVGDIFVKIKV